MEAFFKIIFTIIYILAGTLLIAVALITMGFAMWGIANNVNSAETFQATLLDSIGAIVISIAILDVARYVFEQEVFKYKSNVNKTPIAATDTLKKMFVIISIAISLEGLVYIFKAGAEDLTLLLYPSIVIMISVFAMIGLGIYQWMVARAEVLLSGLHNPRNIS